MGVERYLRHSMIDWLDQEGLKNSAVVVIGAGAVGNEVLKNLCLLGIGRIHIIDFDTIEIHNLTRTILFDETHVGRFKSEVAAEICRKIEPNAHITNSTSDFWLSLSIEDLKSYDALFCCVDNFEARLKLNKLCLIADVDFYNAAIDSRSLTAEKYPFGHDSDSACYECNLPASVYTRIGERYSCGWLKKRAFEEKKVPTTIITSSIAGAQISSLFLQKHHPGSPSGSIRYFNDTINLASTVTALQRNHDCLTCSTIKRDHYYFKVKNLVKSTLMELGTGLEDITLYFSDQLILEVNCKLCGARSVINSKAENYDDTLATCASCNLQSNEISFADSMQLSELTERFTDVSLPVKFIHFYFEQQQFIFELEAKHGGT